MSLAAVAPYPTPEPPLPEPMPDGVGRRGLAFSAALHLILGGVFILGLPTLFHPPTPQEMPIAVQLVTIGPETRATHPNPNMPEREAQPIVPVPGPPGPKPVPEASPPKPAPPPSAAAAPPAPPAPPPPEQKPAPPPPPPPVPAPKPAPPPPPPKPVAKVEAPTPAPERPQRVARPQARAEARKYDPGQFDALLKNLAAQDTPPSPDEPPQNTQTASGAPSSQPRAPLGSQLSASEVDLIREQISRCWNMPAGARDAKDLVVEFRVEVGPDGTVAAGDHRRPGARSERPVLPRRRGKRPARLFQPRLPAAAAAAGQIRDLEGPDRRFQPKGFVMSKRRLVFSGALTALVAAALLWSGASARAELHIDITSGQVKPMPIAIPAFAGGGGTEAQAGRNIAGVISADLASSGLFQPLDPRSFIQNVSATDAHRRRASATGAQINAQALVTGSVQTQGDGRLAGRVPAVGRRRRAAADRLRAIPRRSRIGGASPISSPTRSTSGSPARRAISTPASSMSPRSGPAQDRDQAAGDHGSGRRQQSLSDRWPGAGADAALFADGAGDHLSLLCRQHAARLSVQHRYRTAGSARRFPRHDASRRASRPTATG